MGFSGMPTSADLASRLTRLKPLVLSDPREAEAGLRRVLEYARQIGAERQEALALILLAGTSFHQGRYREMLSYAQEALSVSRRARVPDLEARALNNVGLAYHRLGLFDQAIPNFLEGLKLSRQHLDHEGICRALTHIAMMHNALGEYGHALTLHRQVLERAQACGNSVFMAEALYSVAEDYRLLGDYEQALLLGADALAFAREKGLTRYECSSHRVLALALMALGRNDAARQTAQTGLHLAEEFGDDEERAQMLRLIGSALVGLGRAEEAEEALHQSLELCTELGNPGLERDLRSALAELCAARGQHAEAYEHLSARLQLDQMLRAQEQRVRSMELARQMGQEQGEQASEPAAVSQPPALLRPPPFADALTGLAGRPLLQSRLQRALNLLGPQESLGLLQIDVDRMREINEQYGQSLGDSLLGEVGARLSKLLRPGDLTARVGGDEFMVLLSHLAQEGDIALVMNKLLRGLREPFELRGQQLQLSFSLGGVVAPQDGQTVELLFQHVELATERAKRQGRGQGEAARFSADMSAEEERRRRLARDLRQAIAQEELLLHYQGEYALPSGELRGAEALMRWQHPELGLLFPAQFIPIAEENGLIAEMGDWALNEACRQAAEWGFAARGLCIGVNVSALQFEQADLAARVGAVLERHALPGGCLMLELTESMLYRDEALAARHIEELQQLGVQVALDDFGTGYSSLSLLHEMRFQVLKLDRSFLPDLTKPKATYERTRRLLAVVVTLAQSLEMTLIAEGVEQAEQVEFMAQLGAHQVQGYWLGRPQGALDFAAALGETGGIPLA